MARHAPVPHSKETSRHTHAFARTRLAPTVATALTPLFGASTPSADAAVPPSPLAVPGSHPDHLTAAQDGRRIRTARGMAQAVRAVGVALRAVREIQLGPEIHVDLVPRG